MHWGIQWGGGGIAREASSPLRPMSFNFIQFLVKLLLKNMFVPPFWEILDPALLYIFADAILCETVETVIVLRIKILLVPEN